MIAGGLKGHIGIEDMERRALAGGEGAYTDLVDEELPPLEPALHTRQRPAERGGVRGSEDRRVGLARPAAGRRRAARRDPVPRDERGRPPPLRQRGRADRRARDREGARRAAEARAGRPPAVAGGARGREADRRRDAQAPAAQVAHAAPTTSSGARAPRSFEADRAPAKEQDAHGTSTSGSNGIGADSPRAVLSAVTLANLESARGFSPKKNGPDYESRDRRRR